MSTDIRRGRQAGFTLVEVVIAMTILSIILAIILGGIRVATHAWWAGISRVEDASSMVVVHGLLRRLISRAYPLVWGEDDTARTAFEGDEKGFRFAVFMPPYPDKPGLHLIEFSATPNDGRLMMARTPYEPEMTEFAATESTKRSVLLEGPFHVGFSYFGSPSRGEPPAWHEAWRDQTSPPQLVRLSVVDTNNRLQWPELVVAPRLDMNMACLGSDVPGECPVNK